MQGSPRGCSSTSSATSEGEHSWNESETSSGKHHGEPSDRGFRFRSGGGAGAAAASADVTSPFLLGAAGAASVALGLLMFPFAPARNLETVPNEAFVFLKPHAQTPAARRAVANELRKQGFQITQEGEIAGTEIDKNQLIDSHYYAIASKATLLEPKQLNVPVEMFQKKFGSTVGLSWSDALKKDIVLNAKQACERLKLSSEELNLYWAESKRAGKLVKFGGGFYCGKIDTAPGTSSDRPLYVMNGFFMSMRQKFVEPGASIYYWVVRWDAKKMPWEDFRGKLLGPTDPATAPEDSLRGMFMQNWRSYGLAAAPDVGDNAVHASASPFEALAERMNWLGVEPEKDSFGRQVLKVIGKTVLNIKGRLSPFLKTFRKECGTGSSSRHRRPGSTSPDETHNQKWLLSLSNNNWKNDPAVTYGPCPIKKSVFDSLEDTDSSYCLALLSMIFTTCYWEKMA
eukprot:g11550.t1